MHATPALFQPFGQSCYNVGPALKQHWVNVSRSLEKPCITFLYLFQLQNKICLYKKTCRFFLDAEQLHGEVDVPSAQHCMYKWYKHGEDLEALYCSAKTKDSICLLVKWADIAFLALYGSIVGLHYQLCFSTFWHFVVSFNINQIKWLPICQWRSNSWQAVGLCWKNR